MKNDNSPAIYVGTYGQYNNGSLYGKWFYLTDYANYDELLNAVNAYHSQESDPEFMVQDVQHMPDGMTFDESLNRQDFDDCMTAYREQIAAEDKEEVEQPSPYQIIDYSEKALAVIGDTKEIKDQLKSMGGRFNGRLSCGPGWIFSKKKEAELKQLLTTVQTAEGTTFDKVPAKKSEPYKDALAEYRKEPSLSEYERERLQKNYYGAVKLSDGSYYLLPKDNIRTTFWFHDEGDNYEYYKKVTSSEERMTQYFFDDNQILKNALYHLEHRSELIRYPDNHSNFDPNKPRYGEIPESYRESCDRIRKGIEWARQQHRKRLETWMKRWGVRRLRFGTYWADR